MFCSQCGRLLPEQARFCSGCGTRVRLQEKGADMTAPAPEEASALPRAETVEMEQPASAQNLFQDDEAEKEEQQQMLADVASTVEDVIRLRQQRALEETEEIPPAPAFDEPAPELPGTAGVPVPAASQTDTPTGRVLRAVRTVLWILIGLAFVVAEIYVFFFVRPEIRGELLGYAVMACVLVVSAALFLIVGVACGGKKAGSGAD